MPNHVFLVPTKNEEKAIRFVLGKIRDKFPYHKIIVVDGHSTDNTVRIAKECLFSHFREPRNASLPVSALDHQI